VENYNGPPYLTEFVFDPRLGKVCQPPDLYNHYVQSTRMWEAPLNQTRSRLNTKLLRWSSKLNYPIQTRLSRNIKSNPNQIKELTFSRN